MLSGTQTYTESGSEGDLKISMRTKLAGGADTLQTRPIHLKVETGVNSLANQTVLIKLVGGEFFVTANGVYEDVSVEPYYTDSIVATLIGDNFIVVQGKGFQARMSKSGDIFMRIGPKYSKLVRFYQL